MCKICKASTGQVGYICPNDNSCIIRKIRRQIMEKKIEAEVRIPHSYNEEIAISEEVAEIIKMDDAVNVSEFKWFVVNKNANILQLADVYEEHEMYILLGYRVGI